MDRASRLRRFHSCTFKARTALFRGPSTRGLGWRIGAGSSVDEQMKQWQGLTESCRRVIGRFSRVLRGVLTPLPPIFQR
jgi:hypothetical protein